MRNSTSSDRVLRNWAFSLLELLVVLVLVALVSATVVMRWSGVQQDATLESSVRQLEFWDAHMRRYARSHGVSCNLAFDLKEHRVRKQYHQSSNNNPPWEPLGRSIQLKQIRSTTKSSQKNNVKIGFQRDGTSATYGIELLGPGEQQVWLIVAGVSGQITRLATQDEYEDTLQVLSPQQ